MSTRRRHGTRPVRMICRIRARQHGLKGTPNARLCVWGPKPILQLRQKLSAQRPIRFFIVWAHLRPSRASR
jgi:hypothetical protein